MNVKQFGLTKGRSTNGASVELIQQIFDAWEDSRDAIGVFCDLSKAFDYVHYDTLIRKLLHYGLMGQSLELLESYLTLTGRALTSNTYVNRAPALNNNRRRQGHGPAGPALCDGGADR
ncbi:hypothetical protein EVAR_24499_1 [Eumeta japonica]|uniref:Uncharacterized protein n=1 Tax=Eumeta variegata TaxID=151549 RepID=A0A4C1USN8_EUMVA|nr:hypothetical protein EVAR_24499_1 [Eumeta japonica]